MTEKPKRILFLDGLRGVAILMVVLFHAYAHWPRFFPYGDRFSQIVFFKYGGLGVFLFFMISGFVILRTLENSADFFSFLYRRWLRLFPAMFIVSILIFFTARIFFSERPDGIPEIKDLLPGIALIDGYNLSKVFHFPIGILEGDFWSLFVEVKFYVIFGLVFFALGRDMAIASLIGLFVCGVLNFHLIVPSSSQYMGWFASGAIYYLYFKYGDKKFLYMGLVMSLICSLYLYCFHRDMVCVAASIIMSLFFLAVMISHALQTIMSWRFFLFLGFISYPLYLVHENMMVSLIVKIGHWMPFIPGVLIPIVPIIVVGAIAWLVAIFFEPGFRSVLRRIWEWKLARS